MSKPLYLRENTYYNRSANVSIMQRQSSDLDRNAAVRRNNGVESDGQSILSSSGTAKAGYAVNVAKRTYLSAMQLKLDSFSMATIASGHHPRMFYVILEQNYAQAEKLGKELNDMDHTKLQRLERPYSGMPCLLKYKEKWHRAETCRVHDLSVKLVDNGDLVYHKSRAGTIHFDLKDMLVLPDGYERIPKMAIQCAIVGDLENMSDASHAHFATLIGQEVGIQVHGQMEYGYSVRLFEHFNPLKFKAVPEDKARTISSIIPELKIDVMIREESTPSDMIALKYDGGYGKMLASLKECYRLPHKQLKAIELVKGLPVAVPLGKSIVRGVVTENGTSDGYECEIYLVDIGKTIGSKITTLMPLLPKYCGLGGRAFRCTIADSTVTFPEKFITADRMYRIELETISVPPPYKVEALKCLGKNGPSWTYRKGDIVTIESKTSGKKTMESRFSKNTPSLPIQSSTPRPKVTIERGYMASASPSIKKDDRLPANSSCPITDDPCILNIITFTSVGDTGDEEKKQLNTNLMDVESGVPATHENVIEVNGNKSDLLQDSDEEALTDEVEGTVEQDKEHSDVMWTGEATNLIELCNSNNDSMERCDDLLHSSVVNEYLSVRGDEIKSSEEPEEDCGVEESGHDTSYYEDECEEEMPSFSKVWAVQSPDKVDLQTVVEEQVGDTDSQASDGLVESMVEKLIIDILGNVIAKVGK